MVELLKQAGATEIGRHSPLNKGLYLPIGEVFRMEIGWLSGPGNGYLQGQILP